MPLTGVINYVFGKNFAVFLSAYCWKRRVILTTAVDDVVFWRSSVIYYSKQFYFYTRGPQQSAYRRSQRQASHWFPVQFSSVQFNLFWVLRGKVSERLQPEKMSLEPCDRWTGSEGEVAVSSRQLELRWRSSAYWAYCSCSCSTCRLWHSRQASVCCLFTVFGVTRMLLAWLTAVTGRRCTSGSVRCPVTDVINGSVPPVQYARRWPCQQDLATCRLLLWMRWANSSQSRLIFVQPLTSIWLARSRA